MTQRAELTGTQWLTYTQGWGIENRLVEITSSLGYTTTFFYNADGERVKKVDSTGGWFYISNYFEKDMTRNVSTTYYYLGSQRVTMRVTPSGSYSGALYWIQGDQLGSASLTTNITGAVVSEQRYYPFGETRYVSGTMPTDRLFTGQRSESTGLVGSLADFAAREYSPLLGRFLSADSIVPKPGNPQSLNRFAYSLNNPLKFVDPTGHCPAPPNDSGNVICVDLFIATPKIENGLGYGDDRSYDSNSDPAKSRAYTYIYLDKDGKYLSNKVFVNPSCTVIGCFGPVMEFNKIHVTQDDNGSLHISWQLKNGFAGEMLKNIEQVEEMNKSLPPDQQSSPAGFVAALVATNMNEDINGELVLNPDGNGKYSAGPMNRDPYPSLEVYYYSDGKNAKTILRQPEWPSGKPSIGLRPDVPRDFIPWFYMPLATR
jgi:RHS repeat-associated protein